MIKDDYIKLLLDSSFKEANLFWVRNSAFFVVQALLLGFVINIIFKDITTMTSQQRDNFYLILYILKIFGLLISLFHIIVIAYSRHYNLIWFNKLKNLLATNTKYEEGDINKDLYNVLNKYDCICMPRVNVITFTLLIPIIFIILWILLIIF
jgi:hypothetical protein